VSFIWFWTFWHWSTEAFRDGALLHGPVLGIGSHWDEWYSHEASVDERQAIEQVGRSSEGQRRFVSWLVRHWATEADWSGEHPPARFVLAQLANLSPFSHWSSFAKYRSGYGVDGIAAIVLAEGSSGEVTDVREVEALTIAADDDANAPAVVPEGFNVDAVELRMARDAALNLLRGSGFWLLLALWLASGQRPYRRAIAVMLGFGWVVAGALIVELIVGPEPGEQLAIISGLLTALWITLTVTGLVVAAVLVGEAWRVGRRWGERLERGQVRLHTEGGLTILGGSAGVPFALNMLLAVYRAPPREQTHSWLWERVLRRMRSAAKSWAGTGVVTADGRIRAVALEPKLQACLRHPDIIDVLTPYQPEARQRVIAQLADALPNGTNEMTGATPARGVTTRAMARQRLGFAHQRPVLRSHRCRHLAQAVLAVGRLTSRWQMAVNALALGVSVVMLMALRDIKPILLPPRAPMAVAPFSRSQYQLWVSLDTQSPRDFDVVLESGFWANRRANVEAYAGPEASVRAELELNRLSHQLTRDVEDGTVWVERRRRFLTREFAPGERVGRYSLSYLRRYP
jgi:hypothetical protein